MIRKSLDKEYTKMCGAAFFLYFSYALSRSPIIPLYAKSLGANPETIGIVVAASTITGILIKFPSGILSDILGRKTLLLLGALFFAFTPFFYPVVTSVTILLLIRFVHGNATAIYSPTASAAISEITTVENRGIKLGLYSSIQGIGQTLAPIAGGILISSFGFGVPFFISGIFALIGLSIVTFLKNPSPSHVRKDIGKYFISGIKEVISNKNILFTSTIVASQMIVVGGYNGFFPIYAMESLKLDAWHIGIIFGVQSITTLLARPVMGKFSDTFGRKPLITFALFTSVILISVLSFINSFLILLIIGCIWGLTTSVISSVTVAFITDLSKKEIYGAAHGTFGTIYDIGEAAGPIIAGFILAKFGFSVMFSILALQLLIFTIFFSFTKFKGNIKNEIQIN